MFMGSRSFAMTANLCGILTVIMAPLGYAQDVNPPWPDHIQLVLDQTRPLAHDHGQRLPLFLWPAMNPGPLDDVRAEKLVRALDERGIGLVTSWNHTRVEQSLAECLPVARAQKRLGLRVNINATGPLYGFFDGNDETAHLDEDNRPHFDDSFGSHKMGCPFRLQHRIAPMRERIEAFTRTYAREDLPIGFIFADWEIDGPIEWNKAHEHAKRCKVCREHVPQIDNFLAFQHAIRRIRSQLQREAYAEPVLRHFQDALVGNYAVYPHDGWRYWYDYFEHVIDGYTDPDPGLPVRADQNARYRHWDNEFAETGYTFAMPVVYPWSWTWGWYDFEPGDYRWFYNGLLVASNAGQHTPPEVPIIAFVHYHTVKVGPEDLPEPPQMSEWCYRELLWHMLLRGTDTFFLWCPKEQNKREVELLHPVWAVAQQYGDFLENGIPIAFDVPGRPGPVISGLRLGHRILVRRTDFTDTTTPVTISIAGQSLDIPRAPGRCQIIPLRQ